MTLLLVALIGVSTSFYCNHKKWKKHQCWGGYNHSDISFIKQRIAMLTADKSILYPTHIDNEPFIFSDLMSSDTVACVTNEIGKDIYDFSNISFKEGDVVIDIGGNVGMVSIYLAKKYPFLKIYAFEPVKQNYENFKKNIKLNNIPDGIIFVEHAAVTKDGRDIRMSVDTINSGGSSIESIDWGKQDPLSAAEELTSSITLDQIFDKYNIQHCKLLKMDCEGSEYEILYNTTQETLKKCENLRAEFHTNPSIAKQFGTGQQLLDFSKKHIKNVEANILGDFNY